MLERAAPFATPVAALGAYAGAYASDELDVTYTISAADGRLVVRIPGRAEIALQSIERDLFAGPLVGALRFSRERGGTVTGFAIRAHGAFDIRFVRRGRGAP